MCCSRKHPYRSHGGFFGFNNPPVPLEIHVFVIFPCKNLAFCAPSPPLPSPLLSCPLLLSPPFSSPPLWDGYGWYFLESLIAYLYTILVLVCCCCFYFVNRLKAMLASIADQSWKERSVLFVQDTWQFTSVMSRTKYINSCMLVYVLKASLEQSSTQAYTVSFGMGHGNCVPL